MDLMADPPTPATVCGRLAAPGPALGAGLWARHYAGSIGGAWHPRSARRPAPGAAKINH